MPRFLPDNFLSLRRLIPAVGAVFFLAFIVWYVLLLYLPPGDGKRVHALTVAKGAGFLTVANELKQTGMIRSALHLRILARLGGFDRRMQPGDYRISDKMLPSEILEKMANGQTDACRFTLPEGYSIYQAAELLERQGIFKREGFLAACSDEKLLERLKIKGKTVEGYLFPGRYQIGFKMDEAALITEMVLEFRHRIKPLQSLFEQHYLPLGKVLILASMIEKEAVLAEEKPLIASVFLNRLRIGMPLQSDPTAIYGVKVFGGTVKKQDLQRPGEYNTYKIKGLPPGPIGNPGFDSIQAVLQPARTDYLYFVARKDGTHQFSMTLGEHNRGVNRFLKKGKRR